MQLTSSLLLPLLSLASLVASQGAPDIISLLKGTPSLSKLTATLSKFPDLTTVLGRASNITVLAPSDAAFDEFLSMPNIGEVTEADLKALLTYHVLNGSFPSTAFSKTPAFVPTLLGEYPTFHNLSGAAQVVKAVVEDNKPAIYGGLNMKISVEKADVKFSGGIIHIVDSVIPPPMSISETAKQENLTSLAGVLMKARLVEAVDALAGVTIFAPTNRAFDAIGNLLPGLSITQLTDILTYHVVVGTVGYSTLLKGGQKIKTLNGKDVTVTIENGKVFINGAQVIVADVLTNNGVVHVIDNVLNPNNTQDTPEPSKSVQPPAFASATRGERPSKTSDELPSSTNGVGQVGVSALLVVGAGLLAVGIMA